MNNSVPVQGPHAEDEFLRRFEFVIASRPDGGPAQWKRHGVLYNHNEALVIAHRLAAQEVQDIINGVYP